MIDRIAPDGEHYGYLKPVNPGRFSIECDKLPDGKIFGTADILYGLGRENTVCGYSYYHQIFACTHACSKITNFDAKSDRVLLMTNDSQMAPMIPVFAQYFKKVITLDYRGGSSARHLYEHEDITDLTVQVSPSNPISKYTVTNFL